MLLVGPFALAVLGFVVPLAFMPVLDWVTDWRAEAAMMTSVREVGRDALTSDQMQWNFTERAPIVIDDDPAWGKLVEGHDRVFNRTLTAVQVTNSTPEPDGTFKKVWLRVPSRGDRQGVRTCQHAKCGKDIAWPPRTAREAIAWTFQLCVNHYKPVKAS